MSAENNIVIDVVEENGQVKALTPTDYINVGDPIKQMTKGKFPDDFTAAGYPWAPWGCSDRFPTEIREKLQAVPMAMAAISRLIAMMYGNGICYYRNSDLKDGNTTVTRAYIPEVEMFLKRNRISRFLLAQMADYRFYMNAFSEMVLNRRKNKIVEIYHKPAEFCRLSLQNKRTLNIDYLKYSPDFVLGLQPHDDRIKNIRLFRWYDEERFLQTLRGYKFAYHSHFPTPGITYYARPFWIGLAKDGGWLEVASNVSRIVSAMQNNQICLKYQILIPETWFIIRHPEWDAYTHEQRKTIIDTKIEQLNGFLGGVDNVYKSISSVFKEDPATHTSYGKIEIVPIDDKTKKDAWVPNSNIADAQIVQGLGLHPSQVGLAPEGGKMGAGSGSDQRESYNTGIQLNTMDQEIILEPLNYVSEFNGWGITFMFDHTYHTTTNNQEDGLQPSSTTIQLQ